MSQAGQCPRHHTSSDADEGAEAPGQCATVDVDCVAAYQAVDAQRNYMLHAASYRYFDTIDGRPHSQLQICDEHTVAQDGAGSDWQIHSLMSSKELPAGRIASFLYAVAQTYPRPSLAEPRSYRDPMIIMVNSMRTLIVENHKIVERQCS